METILLVGNFRASVTAVRSLGRAGFRILVAVSDEPSFAEFSRYCDSYVLQPDMETPESFVAGVTELLEAHPEVTRLFPVDQERVMLTTRCRDRLPPRLRPVIADPTTIEICLDKARLFGLAKTMGIPVERYARANDLQALSQAADDLGFPCIVRPMGSGPKLMPSGRKAVILPGRESLADEFHEWPEGHEALLVQRYAPGVRHGIYFAARDGRLLGRDHEPPDAWTYPAGVRYAWTFGDIRALREARSDGEISFSQACRWSARIAASALRADVHLVWSLSDPMPALATYAYWAPFGLGRWVFRHRKDLGDLRTASERM